MKRRDLLKLSAFTGLAAISTQASAEACSTDGTPNQFIPKKAADAKPLEGDIEKYKKCPYCGMDRQEHNKTRMLVQYSDDLSDGVCSIHCLALSLGVNIDREPKNIWGPDFGATVEPRPLLPVDQLTYLIGADLKHAMTKKSKHSFASLDVAKEFQAKHGGNLAKFEDALRESYLGMADDVAQIRKNREERRKRMQQKQS
jgi:nitrous oxide reductase accessory protein NosL